MEELLGIDINTDYYYITGKERIKVKIRLWVIDLYIEAYFDTVNHDKLISVLTF